MTEAATIHWAARERAFVPGLDSDLDSDPAAIQDQTSSIPSVIYPTSTTTLRQAQFAAVETLEASTLHSDALPEILHLRIRVREVAATGFPERRQTIGLALERSVQLQKNKAAIALLEAWLTERETEQSQAQGLERTITDLQESREKLRRLYPLAGSSCSILAFLAT